MTRALLHPLILLTALLWLAAGPAAADLSKTRQLMALIRFDAAMERFSSSGAEALETEVQGLPDQVATALATLWSRHFEARSLIAEITASVAADLSDDQRDALLALYATPQALRITEIEAAAQSGAAREARGAEAEDLLARLQEAGDPRLALHDRRARATDAVEVSVVSGLNSTYAMLAAMMGSPRFPQVLDDAQLLALVNSLEPRLRAEAEREIAMAAAYTYRDLTEAELSDYAELMEGEGPSALYAAVNRAMERIVVERARRFGAAAMEATGARDI